MTTDANVHVLLIEDNRSDALLVRRAFEEQVSTSYLLTHVERLEQGLERLRTERFQIALLDLALPDAFGIEVVDRVCAAAPEMAVLVFTVTDDDGMALQALQKGAQEYLVKSRLDWHTLRRAMRYAVERKRGEQERMRALARAEAALRARDSILGIVSHDLRGPLQAISIGAVLLREPNLTQEQRIRQLESIHRSTEQMTRLIHDLLDVARIEAGHLSVSTAPLDSSTIVREAVELNRDVALQKGLHLEARYPDGLPPVEGDRDRVLQIFYNLLGNAMKFTPQGGRIVVGAELLERAVQFYVTDSGPGIRAEDQPHLFDPYWQATQPNRQSAGLGLFITKGLAEAHGGSVWVKSEQGRGSTFSFTIPVSSGQPPQA